MDYGAIISALTVTSLAGGFSLFNLLVTKDQKISEFRQVWIDAVRSDMSDFVAQAHLISAHLKSHKGIENPQGTSTQFLKDTAENYTALNQTSVRIRLRMNKKEAIPQKVLKILDSTEKLLGDTLAFALNPTGLPELDILTTELVLAGADLLKLEWGKVKRGETLYILGKWLTGAVLIFSFLLLLWILVCGTSENPMPTHLWVFHRIRN